MKLPAAAVLPPPVRPQPGCEKRLLEQLAALRAMLWSAAQHLASCLRHFRSFRQLPGHPGRSGPPEWLEPQPVAVIAMVSAVLRGGPYCGDEISVPADACRLTRPDGSVYLRSSLTDSAGRPVFMLRLGRRTLDLPRQSDLS